VDLERLLQGSETIALDAVEHVADFRPRMFTAAPPTLKRHLDEAVALARAGRLREARTGYMMAVIEPGVREELAAYREHVTWIEAENAARLAALAWVYTTLMPRALEGDHVLMGKLVELERIASDDYGVRGPISSERGWADRQTMRRDLLPQGWRAV
jgi:hypothetical protein